MPLSFKIVDFPRKEGYAKTINIPFKEIIQFVLNNHNDMAKFVRTFKLIDYISGYENMNILFEWVSKYINTNLLVDSKEQASLEDNNESVVEIAHGDFVRIGNSNYRNEQKGIAYFMNDINRLEIVVTDFSTDINEDDGNIPKDFESVIKDIPLDYWADGDFDYLVWVNLDEYRDPCLANITQLGYNYFKTSFNANNKEYNIIYPGANGDEFEELLRTEGVNKFFRYYYEVEDESDDNITLEGGFSFDLTTTLFTHINPID